jgi:hypothetical protein
MTSKVCKRSFMADMLEIEFQYRYLLFGSYLIVVKSSIDSTLFLFFLKTYQRNSIFFIFSKHNLSIV